MYTSYKIGVNFVWLDAEHDEILLSFLAQTTNEQQIKNSLFTCILFLFLVCLFQTPPQSPKDREWTLKPLVSLLSV